MCTECNGNVAVKYVNEILQYNTFVTDPRVFGYDCYVYIW